MEKVNATIAKYILVLSCCLFPMISFSKSVGHTIILYTPYTSRSVMPGKSLTYHVEVINKTDAIQDVRFKVRGVPENWNPTMSASATTIQEVAIRPKSLGANTENIDLDLNIPLKIKKGLYHFKLIGKTSSGFEYVLPLQVDVTKQGIFKTDLLVNQANREGYANSSFNYTIKLLNRTGQKQNYALIANTLPGWDVRFRANGDYVTSVALASTKSINIYVKVSPPANVNAGKFKIPIRVASGTTSNQVTLVTVIQGKYKLELTTPSGRLSTNVSAGGKKTVKLLLKNTGSLPFHNIKLSAATPDDWNVKFDNVQINQLNPGSSTYVNATIKASNKAIAGDYQLQIHAEAANATARVNFRVTVSQTYTWGFIGILIILVVIGGIFYLFKEYGRR